MRISDWSSDVGSSDLRDDYLRDPQEIARRSFEIVRAETDLAGLPADVGEIALRVVHACGMPEIAPDLACGGDLVGAGRAALQAGATVLAACRLVAECITPAPDLQSAV